MVRQIALALAATFSLSLLGCGEPSSRPIDCDLDVSKLSGQWVSLKGGGTGADVPDKFSRVSFTEKDGKIFFLGSGDYFGDKAVKADVEYVSKETCIIEEDAICWRLKKTDIEAVIGDVKRLGKPIPFTPKAFDSTLTIDDIKKHKMLGMGKCNMYSIVRIVFFCE